MNETQTKAEATTAKANSLKQPAVLIALVALAAALLLWFVNGSRISSIQNDLAHRLGEGDAVANESRADSRQAKEDVQALTARVSLLEAKLNETQGQQAALETMYQELARGRDERLLAEIEQSVAIAAQQLQLAGNVEAALIALQGADTRLTQNGNAQFTNLRHLIERDIDRLKALPQADVSGMAVRLENVTALVDDLPLAYTQRPPRNQNEDKAKLPTPVESAWWKGVFTGAWSEIKQLVRVERMDHDAPALMAPTQALFLRENLRLRLVNARLSLLQRDSQSFRDDVGLATKWLELYFDMSNSDVKLAHDSLQKLAGTNLSLALPTLDETLAALRTLRAAREKK
ncbi:MAG TPA: uroporphyrinogen-III C-methyltransferase [Rhodocyclaceae bacterium]|nr:uroporphyrinogen-III C-methyltransferase [Rhodocyclaceae bacterium]